MDDRTLEIIIKLRDDASRALKDLEGQTGKTSSRLESGAKTVARFGAAVAVAGAIAASAGAAIGFGFNNSVEQAEAKLMAFMKDGQQVARTLAWVKDEAAKTQFSFTDMADAAANLTPVAKTSGQSLESLVRQAEILAALNPAEGLTGATFSLREALSGDWVSIVDRFNLPRQRINELKAQGVPAMEIISRTLQEMGIDYGLVAKQGETTSARFDQLKDKLVMMAGTASKPIFDRVSQELAKLGGADYKGIGEKLAGVFSGIIGAIDWALPYIQEFGRQAGDYLGPKLQQLGNVVQTELAPALTRLWHEVIEPLLPVIGTLLVGAIGLLIDVLSFCVSAWSNTINMIATFGTFIRNLPSIVGQAIGFIGEKLTWMRDNWTYVIGYIIGFVATLPIKLGMFAIQAVGNIVNAVRGIDWGGVFGAIVSGAGAAWNWVINAGRNALNTMINLNWGAIFSGAAKGVGNSVIGLIEGAINGALAGIPGKPQIKVPRFEHGVRDFEGGLAVVGDVAGRGGELLNLPRGTDVYSNRESKDMLGGMGRSVVINQTNYNYTQYDREMADRDLGYRLAHA